MRMHQTAAVAALVTAAVLAVPAAAQTADQGSSGPLQLGEFLKKITSPTPAPATDTAEAPTPASRPARRHHVAARHKAPAPVHHRAAAKELAKSAPPTRQASADDRPELPSTDGRGSPAPQPARPSPAPALGPSPFIGARASSSPPVPETAPAPVESAANSAKTAKAVPSGQANDMDAAADTAVGSPSKEASVQDTAGPSAQTDGRGIEGRDADAAVVTAAADIDPAAASGTPWMPIVLVASGAVLLVGYFGWPLLARRRRRAAA